jgi:hypothetical protein
MSCIQSSSLLCVSHLSLIPRAWFNVMSHFLGREAKKLGENIAACNLHFHHVQDGVDFVIQIWPAKKRLVKV